MRRVPRYGDITLPVGTLQLTWVSGNFEVSAYMSYPRIWIGGAIPGYREGYQTYFRRELDSLPVIPTQPDDSLSWLLAQPSFTSFGQGRQATWGELAVFYDRSAQTVDNLPIVAEQHGFLLPPTYLQFVGDVDLLTRFRSPTGCAFQFPQDILADKDRAFVSLMADYQGCCNWHLLLTARGHSIVATSEFIDDLDTIDETEIVHCADSIDDFLHRLYIESELWYRLNDGFPDLTIEMIQYLELLRKR